MNFLNSAMYEMNTLFLNTLKSQFNSHFLRKNFPSFPDSPGAILYLTPGI